MHALTILSFNKKNVMATLNTFVITAVLAFQFGALHIVPSLCAQPLYVIALLPTTENGSAVSTRCIDRGEELIVAARMASDAINANDTLLQGYTLEVIHGFSDGCTVESFATSLTQFVRYITNDSISNHTVGVIMVCPSTMLHVSPFASLEGISLLQIAAGPTPPTAISRSRDRITIGHIYQAAPSATIFNDALIALMIDQEWRNMETIRLTSSINIIHVNQAADLQMKIDSDDKLNIVFNGEIRSGEDGAGIEQILDEIEARQTRIIYATLPDKEARDMLCAGYYRNIMSPLYTWVLHDHSLDDLKRSTDDCTAEQMGRVLDGALLLRYDASQDGNRRLDYLEMTYNDYESRLIQRLEAESGHSAADTLCGKDPDIVHSNAIYDSVISFALALNKSQANGVDLMQYGRGMPRDTEAINNSLNYMDFQFSGAGGMISFNSSTHELEARIGVNIFQLLNSELVPFARYNGTANSITPLSGYHRDIRDSFEQNIKRVHIALSAAVLAIAAILAVIGVIVLIVFIYHWNSPDVKATSPILSITILLACYLLYISATFTAVRSSFTEGTAFAVLCTLEWWTFIIGIQLIFATLFFRLLRVYRIFFHYQKVGNLWSDKGVLVFIALLSSVSVILLILWTAIDMLRTVKLEIFLSTGSTPHIDVYLNCESDYLGAWLGIIIGYNGLIMLAVLALAIMTRKVKIESFRDTKEVNAFVFTTVFLIVVSIPLSLILQGTSDAALYSTFVLREVCLILVPVACKVFIFAPKIYYAHFDDPTRRKSSFATTGKRTNPRSSFSMSGTV